MHSDERCDGEFKRFHPRPRLTKCVKKTEMHFLADEEVEENALLAKQAAASVKFWLPLILSSSWRARVPMQVATATANSTNK